MLAYVEEAVCCFVSMSCLLLFSNGDNIEVTHVFAFFVCFCGVVGCWLMVFDKVYLLLVS